jgi:purine-nucleoside phosphorylase
METRGSKLAARRPPAGYAQAQKAARYLALRWATPPRVGIILGSGLGEVVHRVRDGRVIPYHSIPSFPRSATAVAGHAGELYAGRWGKIPVAMLAGRIHLYEGYSPAQVVFLTRVLGLAGVEILITTCAAGGIAPGATPGSFMIFSDHLNFQGQNPLAGPHDARWGERFVDLSQAYDRELREKARESAVAASRGGDRLKCFEGVYAAVLGPSYETPAEIRFLQHAGADAVGMSTVPEVIAARQLGVRVLAIATITNRAAGLSRGGLSHQEVLEAGKKASERLVRFLDELLARIQE